MSVSKRLAISFVVLLAQGKCRNIVTRFKIRIGKRRKERKNVRVVSVCVLHFIKGGLQTVQPIALENRRVFAQNCREYTILHTENFGDVMQIEVGALMVGRIVNKHKGGSHSRGEEKGRFEFGGSTIVVLLEKDRAVLDEEFFQNTAADKETIVRCGEKIGSKI